MDPAVLLLEQVWRFWHSYGYSCCEDLTEEEIAKPDNDMRKFLQEPFFVRLALQVWLRGEADLPRAAAFRPMLALWFSDPELPDLDGEEEAAFLDQWMAYVRYARRRRRG
jgi:hypothetical protein